jgi:hypothetical protein
MPSGFDDGKGVGCRGGAEVARMRSAEDVGRSAPTLG